MNLEKRIQQILYSNVGGMLVGGRKKYDANTICPKKRKLTLKKIKNKDGTMKDSYRCVKKGLNPGLKRYLTDYRKYRRQGYEHWIAREMAKKD